MNPEIEKQFTKKEITTIRHYLAITRASQRLKWKKHNQFCKEFNKKQKEAVK